MLSSSMDFFKPLLEQAVGKGKLSSVLQPLIVLVVVLLGALIGMIYAGADQYAITAILYLSGFVIFAFVIAFFYALCCYPDGLRSETFHLKKIVIERQIGDHNIGMIDPVDLEDVTKLPSQSHKEGV